MLNVFLRPTYVTLFILFIGVVLTTWNVYWLRKIQNRFFEERPLESNSEGTCTKISENLYSRSMNEAERGPKKPIAWILGQNIESGYLTHIIEAFERLGYQIFKNFNSLPKDFKFDVMWSHEYPFFKSELKPYIDSLQSHQLVNHVPGSGYYTSKVSLATAGLKMGVPLAFEMPKEKEKFLKFANEHPDYFWVQKSNAHRGIKILKVNELELDKSETFIQRYVENPFLIDGKKFDIGIYTVITSIDPLRIYIYDSDALFRFCPENYEPFDPNNEDKYVVADDYTPIWEMPSLKKYYNNLNLNFKETFNQYLKSIGKDHAQIWSQIEEIIRQVFESQNLNMQNAMHGHKQKRSFFELARFDFVVDKDLKVFLMEANMSPNLSSSHFVQNKLLYEQVLLNILSLVGVAIHLHGFDRQTLAYDKDLVQSQVSNKDLNIFIQECYEEKCTSCSEKMICKLCTHCMNSDLREDLRKAYMEHLSKRNMKRILPFSGSSSRKSPYETLSEKSKLQELWFNKKCENEKLLCY